MMAEFRYRRGRLKKPVKKGALREVAGDLSAGVAYLKDVAKKKKRNVSPYSDEFLESELAPRYSALERRVRRERENPKNNEAKRRGSK